MAIVNATPDSFFAKSRLPQQGGALEDAIGSLIESGHTDLGPAGTHLLDHPSAVKVTRRLPREDQDPRGAVLLAHAVSTR